MRREKEYMKCYLIGDDNNQIIAEVNKYWDMHGYCHYKKGKDLVTGTPIILYCDENFFGDEVTDYGFNRIYRLGVWASSEAISKQGALDFLKSMTRDDAQRYSQTIKRAQKKHYEMIKENIVSVLKEKQLYYNENIDMKAQQIKVRIKGKF